MTNYDEYVAERMKNPEFKDAYDSMEADYEIVEAISYAYNQLGLTKKELSDRTGIPTREISKMESANANPSLKTLKRLAEGAGLKLKIEFVPKK